MEILLGHYGSPLENQTHVRFDSVVSADACRGEFLPFKCLVHHHLGENRRNNDGGVEHWHYFTPLELIKRIFGGHMQVNQTIFPGKRIANGKP